MQPTQPNRPGRTERDVINASVSFFHVPASLPTPGSVTLVSRNRLQERTSSFADGRESQAARFAVVSTTTAALVGQPAVCVNRKCVKNKKRERERGSRHRHTHTHTRTHALTLTSTHCRCRLIVTVAFTSTETHTQFKHTHTHTHTHARMHTYTQSGFYSRL